MTFEPMFKVGLKAAAVKAPEITEAALKEAVEQYMLEYGLKMAEEIEKEHMEEMLKETVLKDVPFKTVIAKGTVTLAVPTVIAGAAYLLKFKDLWKDPPLSPEEERAFRLRRRENCRTAAETRAEYDRTIREERERREQAEERRTMQATLLDISRKTTEMQTSLKQNQTDMQTNPNRQLNNQRLTISRRDMGFFGAGMGSLGALIAAVGPISWCDGRPYRVTDSVPSNRQTNGVSYERDADEWMRHLQEKSHSLLYQEFLDGDSRIKIAMLDSGIDRDNIELANDTRIIHRRAFASENTDDWHDNQGHGTHLAGLLRKVAPHAEICVAKVTRVRLVGGVEMEEMEHADVARAIRHAVREWGVNIISLSSTFLQSHEDVTRALRYAAHHSVLVFVAAGNHGQNEPVRFPATDNNTIAIFSSDGQGHPSQDNSAAVEGEIRFCTLGMGVESNWPIALSDTKLERKSGSSQATPIAAGTAAMVLEFAAKVQSLAEAGLEYPAMNQMWWLKSGDGMRKVFHELLSTSVNQGSQYRYVRPWKLLNARGPGDDPYKAAAVKLGLLMEEWAA